MTHPPSASADDQARQAATLARQRATTLLHGTGLDIQERPFELVISNPRDPERGQIHIANEDGYVSWERTTWDYWGPLEGYEASHPDHGAPITASTIITTLTGRM